jgi:carbon monoxide dehydrogenase subunit G
MPTVRESTDVSVTPERIFQMLEDPKRAESFIPGLTRITNVTDGAWSVGTGWDYEFDWFGVVVTGHSQCTRFERPNLYQFKTLTGNPSTWTYQIDPAGKGSRLTLEVDYEVPHNMLARFSRAVLEQMNQKRAKEIVGNLKALVED